MIGAATRRLFVKLTVNSIADLYSKLFTLYHYTQQTAQEIEELKPFIEPLRSAVEALSKALNNVQVQVEASSSCRLEGGCD